MRLQAALLLVVLAATPAGAQHSGKTVTPALVKGTQGASGYAVQEVKDAGRTLVTLTADAVAPATSETLVTVAKLVGDTVTAGVTTYAVTSGKTLRVQAVLVQVTQTSVTATKVRVRLRTLSSGACLATSPVVATVELGPPPGTLAANVGTVSAELPIPDGVDFSGATRNVCLSAVGTAVTATLTVTLVAFEY